VRRNEQSVTGSPRGAAARGHPTDPTADQPDRLGVLNVAGDLNREGLDLLRQRCRAELAAQVTTLVIDFTGMTDFPSALFGLRAETGATLRNRDARLQMIGLYEAIDPRCRRAFDVRLHRLSSRLDPRTPGSITR
jgi:hypothetical protein